MIDISQHKSTKPVTVQINEPVLKEIETYGISYSDFIREAVNKHLQKLEKEKLIQAYKEALENTREESQEVNELCFNASIVANNPI